MDYTNIIKVIQERYSNCYANKDFYSKSLKLWLSLYKGEKQSYHTLRVSNGITNPKREMYRLNMAPRVARDWKSATLNEDIDIVVNSTNNKSSVFLQGTKGNGGVLGDNNFTVLLSSVIEKMYALGTSAIAIDLDAVNVDDMGNITATTDSKIRLKQYNAMQIIPISWHNNIIDEVAFVSTINVSGKKYTTLSVHKKENGTYVIYNTILNKDFNEVTLDNVNTAKVVKTNSEKPLFIIFKTNIDNNIDLLGLSVYADAIDNLKGVDTIYDRAIYEIISGQRLVLMNKALLTTDSDGNCIVPQDERQYFMNFLGDDALSNISEFVKDFTPNFRTNELDKEDSFEQKTILDDLEDRIGQKITVGELNTILQSLFGQYNKVFLLVSDLYNQDPDELQELVVWDDEDMYTITYEITDIMKEEISLTDVVVE